MSWFKVDDKLWGHPKWLALPPGARALWVSAGSWCSDQLTDGEVPRHLLGILGGRSADSRKLVEIGLWNVTENGWQFRDWADYQPSRESVLTDRKAARERQAKAREAARAKRLSRNSHAVTSGEVTGDVTALSHPPDPTRPDPTVLKEVVTNVSSARDEPRSKPVSVGAARLSKAYCDRVKLSDRGKVAMIVTNAIGAGYPDADIESALIRLANDGRSCTTETLRIEIEGPRKASSAGQFGVSAGGMQWEDG